MDEHYARYRAYLLQQQLAQVLLLVVCGSAFACSVTAWAADDCHPSLIAATCLLLGVALIAAVAMALSGNHRKMAFHMGMVVRQRQQARAGHTSAPYPVQAKAVGDGVDPRLAQSDDILGDIWPL